MTGSDSVWAKVLAMEDKINVNYNAVEELFCQKQTQSQDKPTEKKKQPTEVRNVLITVVSIVLENFVFGCFCLLLQNFGKMVKTYEWYFVSR